MSQVIDLNKSRLLLAAKRGFRNWVHHFHEPFGPETRFSQISLKALTFLAQGGDKGTFYLYDLIMHLKGFGSGSEFDELSPEKKMSIIDHYLFLLDRIRFECMKRARLLERYPGEDVPLVDLILNFDTLAPSLHAEIPILSPGHPGYREYSEMNTFDKEVFIRKLIPEFLKEFQDDATTL